MTTIDDILGKLFALPPTTLSFVLALAAVGVAGFAVYAVLSIAKHKERP